MVEGSSRCAKPRSIVMPRAFSSGKRSGSMPVNALTSALLPWSTWPAVATMKLRVVIGLKGRDRPGSADLARLYEDLMNRSKQLLILSRENSAQIELEAIAGDVTNHRRCAATQAGGGRRGGAG